MEFFATCPTGFERLLADELTELGLPRVRPLKGQVAFEGELADAYRACLWCRVASRVVVVLARLDAHDADELYAGVRGVAWEEHLAPGVTIAVDASGTNAKLSNTQYVALRTKDAIVDKIFELRGSRPNVDTREPDARIVVRISRERAMVGLDLAGTPLFQRGYARGRHGSEGSLRADYAAALVLLAGAAGAAEAGAGTGAGAEGAARSVLAVAYDPDVLLVEAALVAARRAPGLSRGTWGFRGWAAHDEAVWSEVVAEARSAQVSSVGASGATSPGDADASEHTTPALRLVAVSWRRATSHAKGTLQAMGIEADVRTLLPDATPEGHVDLLLCDASFPAASDAPVQAKLLGSVSGMVRSLAPAAVAIASRDDLPKAYVRQEPQATVDGMLGREPLLLRGFACGTVAGSAGTTGTDAEPAGGAVPVLELPSGKSIPLLLESSLQFAARLRKNARLRAKWARREDVSCYRLYDSDLPDYAITVDLFQGSDPHTGELDGRRWLQVYEYAPPRGVDPTLARARLMDALAIAPALLDVREGNTFLRVRRRDKGGSQYAAEALGGGAAGGGAGRDGRGPAGGAGRDKDRTHPKRRASDLPPGAHLIQEGGLTFEVNFQSRLDCGIFLDHRTTRAMLREMAKETKGSKRFLNLFAYTGTATCYAADGGMKHTTTVDLSRPSLEWARRNMERNGFSGPEHEYLQEDVVRWVREQRRTRNRWDLVFCDVPTFSNSNRMGRRSFDVQRDHVELLICVSRVLTRDGVCVFSCNLRTFRPDVDALQAAGVAIEDITDKTIPEDFSRNQRIHHAYLVRRT